jgi:hypothetical protein
MISRLMIIGAAALLECSCATRPRVAIQSVCVEFKDMPEHEVAYMRKRTASYLGEYGLSQAASGCDVNVKFQPFGTFQGEIAGGIVKAGYWSEEGTVTITHNGQTVLEDEPIALRGYDSRQSVLDATAWQAVKPVTKKFRAAQ